MPRRLPGNRSLSQQGLPILVVAIFCWVLHTLYLSTIVLPKEGKLLEGGLRSGATTARHRGKKNKEKPTDAVKHTSTINNTESLYIITTNEESPSNTCSCDFISTDCLSSMQCIPNHQTSLQQTARGILLRKFIKETAKFKIEEPYHNSFPLGKLLQYKSIKSWSSWVEHNEIPEQHAPMPQYKFVNSSRYADCREKNLTGFHCYFTPYSEDEEYGDIELEAEPYVKEILNSKDKSHELMSRLKTLQRVQLQNAVRVGGRDKRNNVDLLDYLTSMAHFLRIQFNRRHPLIEITSRAIVYNVKTEEQDALKEEQTSPLCVGLHLRRADSCMNGNPYRKEVSSLFKSAQPSSLRACYETSVYMNALRRVNAMVRGKEPGRHIEVFVSSDHAGALIEEIQKHFADLYKTMTWHFHSTGREVFNYSGYVEGSDHSHSVHDILGESAAADLWLLSRGEVFIGHLGSRFGKVAYLLATARHNRFIPFLSVDGHSYCCEVDEPCGEMKPYITTMTECLVFSHELLLDNDMLNEDYWEVGSLARKIIAEQNGQKQIAGAEGTNNM